LKSVSPDDLKLTYNVLDTNKDGMVSLAENIYSYHLDGLFNRIDDDKDGLVSSMELNKWIALPGLLRLFENHNTYSKNNLLKFYEFETYYNKKTLSHI